MVRCPELRGCRLLEVGIYYRYHLIYSMGVRGFSGPQRVWDVFLNIQYFFSTHYTSGKTFIKKEYF